MKMMNKVGALLLSAVLCIVMAAPAFAYGGDVTEEVEQPVLTDTSEEDAVTVTDETSGALTPEGNLTLVDDYHTSYSDGSGQQFITLVSKSGNTFYLVIDRNAKGQQTVHFMNLVDEADLLALMEEKAADAYTAEGKILTEQPSEDAKKKLLEGTEYIDLILYAYDAAGENCLWQGIGAGKTAEDYCFGQEMIGLEIRPEYTGYEVVADMTDTTTNGADSADNTDNAADGTTGDTAGSDPKIRIYDGEVQWFDGTYWVSAGSVRDMAKQDPFAAYEENHATGATGGTGSITGSTNGNASNANDGQNITGNTGTAGDKTGGSIQKPTPTPAATAKPATKPATSTPKPAAKPAATAKPTPAPTQAPAQDDHNDDHDDNNDNDNNNNSDNNSNNDNNSGDSGNNGGNSGGNDVDVEWTPDLM